MTARLMKLAALLLCLTVAMWATDPWLGTWKLNVAKSKFDPGLPAKSSSHTIEMVGDQQKFTTEWLWATGEKEKGTWIGKPDGKDYPLQNGPNAGATRAVRVLSPTVQEHVWKVNGKVSLTARRVLSKDGKIITGTVKGTTAQGKSFTNTYVFEKQ